VSEGASRYFATKIASKGTLLHRLDVSAGRDICLYRLVIGAGLFRLEFVSGARSTGP
jgi:hypothetical protein